MASVWLTAQLKPWICLLILLCLHFLFKSENSNKGCQMYVSLYGQISTCGKGTKSNITTQLHSSYRSKMILCMQ